MNLKFFIKERIKGRAIRDDDEKANMVKFDEPY